MYLLHKSKHLLRAAALALVLLTSGASAQQTPHTVDFHLACYPSRYIPWSKTQTWASENCNSYEATYIRMYEDNNNDRIFLLRIDGRIERVRPRRMITFQPLYQWEYGDTLEVEFDGYFQDKSVRHLVQYWGMDKADDYDFMLQVLSWDTRYLHLNRVQE